MIVFNITTHVSWAIHDKWREWLIGEYLPAIMNTGFFTHFQFVKLIEVDEEEGATYAVQLYSNDNDSLNKFRSLHLIDFQKKEKKIWGDGALSFSSVMEVIN